MGATLTNSATTFMFYYSILPNHTFEIKSDKGDVFTVKPLIPQLADFADNQLHQWGALLCGLFEKYCTSFSDDLSYAVYRVHTDLAWGYNILCQIKSDTIKESERERIGRRIKEIRKEKNMGAKELAALTGCDAANICKIEQGRYSVGYDILAKIALSLGYQLDFVPLENENK